jgi:SAM-dependent methyltransferase
VGFDALRAGVAGYYSAKLAEHGATARGVDWNGEESQELRFAQLAKAIDAEGRFTLNDYGCGYGALARFLAGLGYEFAYTGFDIAPAMVERARQELAGRDDVRVVGRDQELEPADYTLASGIFNVKLDAPAGEWERYVHRTLDRLAELSTRAFAFNMLTSYSDPERMRDDLWYADPRDVFDRCKRRYSRHVALLHDYGLYEFTTIVRL